MPENTATWCVTPDASNAEAEAVLAHDRIWNCFALADLAPPFREYSQIALAQRDQSEAEQFATCLILRQPTLTVLSPYGDRDGVAVILAHLAAQRALPNQTLIQAQRDYLPLLGRYYALPPNGRELLRMAVSSETFVSPSSPASLVEQLTLADLPALTALYALYPTGHFQANLLQHEVFFGIRSSDGLLAVGGTHAMTPAYGIAVLGNIFTHPEARGRGYARSITAALVADLFAHGCRDVALNVLADNAPAIHVYTRLGFQTHSRYWSAEATLRETQ